MSVVEAWKTMQAEIDELMAKLGAEIGFPDLAFDETGYVAIINEDGTVLNFDHYPDQTAIVVYSTVAELKDETRFDIYEEMLMANFMWKETCGATLSVSPTTEHALLMASLPTEGLDLPTLIRFYENVHRLTWAFSDRFKSIAGEDDAAAVSTDPSDAPLPSSFA
ncbi:MAG: type III secretion system chaperone [Pseudomonadota bacterium]